MITGNALSLGAMIGFLMLMGIVAKNAILLVDFAIEEMRAGKDRLTAILEATHKRARPIVMTTVAMVAGMMPVAIGLGGDTAFRQPMAVAVIGGLITSTALTLVIVPAALHGHRRHRALARAEIRPCAHRAAPAGRRPSAAPCGQLGAMLSEVSARNTTESEVPEGATPARPAWWVRLLARIPFSLLYGFASSARLAVGTRVPVPPAPGAREPDQGVSGLRRAAAARRDRRLLPLLRADAGRDHQAAGMPPAEIRRRVRIVNLELARAQLDQGQSVLLVAAHQCNWEWMLLALSLELGYPVDAAYKPLVDSWAEREMKKLRTRFGSRLVPAKDLLADIIKRRGIVRAVAMVADQEPTTSEHKHWTRFLNRDTAFYMGPEEIARVTRFPMFFIGFKRTGRGHYEMQFTPLCTPGEVLAPGRAHRALRAPGRSTDPRRAG